MNRLLMPFLNATLAVLTCDGAWAVSPQDTVVIRKSGSDLTSRRVGEIMHWRGSALTLSTAGRDRRIDNEDVDHIETHWSGQADKGRLHLKQGNFLPAIEPLKQAIADESRDWAKTMLRADLVTAYLATEQHEPAVTQFLLILADDPHTRFLRIAPLAWIGNSGAQSLVTRATEWTGSRDSTTRLIAASWLIGSSRQEQAIEILEKLSREPDEQIARLAAAQVWRTRRSVSVKQLQVWQQQVADMPPELQAGPWFVLAEKYAAAESPDQAAIHWMRLPILNPNRPNLAAAALYRAARLLDNNDQSGPSAIVRSELLQKFPDSVWAEKCRTDFR